MPWRGPLALTLTWILTKSTTTNKIAPNSHFNVREVAVPEVRDMPPKPVGVAWDRLLGRLSDSQAAEEGRTLWLP